MSSGVLWGAAAAVLIAGATAAALEAARRRQEEEERQRAEMERRNAEAEAREANLAYLAALAAATAAGAAAANAKDKDDEWPSESRFVGSNRPAMPQAARMVDDRESQQSSTSRSDSMRRTAERRDELPPARPDRPTSLAGRGIGRYIPPMPYDRGPSSSARPWLDRALEWIDRHQREVALGLGFGVGVLVTALTAPVLGPWSIPVGVLAGGAVAGGGTALLNRHYDRPLSDNLVRNTLYGGGGAAFGSAGTYTLMSGMLGKLALGVGNAASAFCVRNPVLCARAEAVLRFVDQAEEWALSAQLTIETALRLPSAGETAIELQLERMDGRLPGNTTFREAYQSFVEAFRRHSEEVARVGSIAARQSDEVLQVSQDGLVYLRRGSEQVEQLAREIEEATGRRVWFSPSRSVIYLSQPTEAGLQAAARLRAAVPAGADEETIRELVEEIARASTRGSGNRVVLGAWKPGGVYIREAVENGGVFFDTGEEVWQMVEASGLDLWKVNEAFMRQQMARGAQFEHILNLANSREMGAFRAALELDEQGIRNALRVQDVPYRFREVMWLVEQGYQPVEGLDGVVRWVKP